MGKRRNLISRESSDIPSNAILETPPLVVLYMINLIPEEYFISNRTTFLDPACGGGSFLKYIYYKLRQHGHSHQNAMGRLFGIDKHSPANETSDIFPNIIKKNFLKMKFPDHWPKKFSIELCNPPYSGGSSVGGRGAGSGKSIWHSFVLKASSLLEEDGMMVFVHPDDWRTFVPSGDKSQGAKREKEEVFSLLTSGKLTNLSMMGKVFPGVKASVDVWALKNDYKGMCNVSFTDGSYSMMELPKGEPITSISPNSAVDKILRKCTTKGYDNGAFIRQSWAGLKVLDKSKPEGNHKLAHGSKMTKDIWVYEKYPHVDQEKNKVIACEIGPLRPRYFKGEDSVGISDHVHYWIVSDDKHGESIKNILNSDIIEYLRINIDPRRIPFWIISSINLKFESEIKNNEDVANHFNLTPEDREEIKSFFEGLENSAVKLG